MAHKYLEDDHGNKSSTRLDATILLILTCLMIAVSFTFALFYKIADGGFILDLIYGGLSAFVACVAGTKLEKFVRNKSK